MTLTQSLQEITLFILIASMFTLQQYSTSKNNPLVMDDSEIFQFNEIL